MTSPQDPFGANPSGGDPLGGTPFGQTLTGPPIFSAGPPPRTPMNNLATLSVIFAFVFAPAGAILGHLGLSEIRRTGQAGRGRALTGLVASYAIIAVAAVVAISSVTQSGSGTTTHTQAAGPGAPVVPTSAAPPPSKVAPGDLAGLMPTDEQMKALTSDFTLTLHQTVTALAELPRAGDVDNKVCESPMIIGDARVYDPAAVRGLHVTDYTDITATTSLEAAQAVSAYDDAGAAQAALKKLLTGWYQCAGSNFTLKFGASGLAEVAGPSVDAGNGITTMTITTTNAPLFTNRAIAAKANVIVDVMVSGKRDLPPVALAVIKFILDKIPA